MSSFCANRFLSGYFSWLETHSALFYLTLRFWLEMKLPEKQEPKWSSLMLDSVVFESDFLLLFCLDVSTRLPDCFGSSSTTTR